MKEIMAFIRLNRINETKEALADEGFPAFTCRKVMGRGKKAVSEAILETIIEQGELPVSPVGEYITEPHRLISKRCITLVVPDSDVEKVVKTIINVNSTGNPGDGKVFVLPVSESIRIRDGENQTDVDSY